jgi:trehalose/maltose hydrolase-like predicted phosphorylase
MSEGWRLVYEGFDPTQEALREALCTLGNGRFATRGAAEESSADEVHYPGTYVSGGYDRLTSVIAGRDVVNEDLVNFPNWLPLSFRAESGVWLGEPASEYEDHCRELDLRGGVLHRAFTVRDPEGRETRVSSRRIVHMGDPHLAAISQEIVPLNWSGKIEIRSGLDGGVANWGVARYRELRGDHMETVEASGTDDGLALLRVRTKQSGLEVSLAARTKVWLGDEAVLSMGRVDERVDSIWHTSEVSVRPGRAIRVEKTVALRTSRDPALGDLVEDALFAVRRAPDFEELLSSHRAAWETLWHLYDVEVDVSPEIDLSPHSIQLILRLHTFHLLQTASPHSVGLDASVPARGLHGEAYRGHIFWDEMYLFPFYLYRDPELARSLLLYRYRRLAEARANAVEDGRAGAMYPWQSGSSGREETQIIHLNPRSGAWDPDHSHLQRHVNAAIAKNVWDYVRVTDDRDFLARFGAEILLEIGRFWASMVSGDADGRFEIAGVMGPDEFHETYPGASEGGLRNNAYTNVMAAWCIERALRALDLLDETEQASLAERVLPTEEEAHRWRKVVRGMRVPVLGNGLIAQFEGYGDLAELDWDAYRARYGSIGRLDRILKAEGDSPDRYQLSKQADLCMLFYVFDQDELADLLARTGYKLTEQKLRQTIEYYRHRTSHGSTLSHLVFAAILDEVDRDASWGHFAEALHSDVDDVQGGTTPEGIHAAVMAGTVRHVIERFAGVRLTAERVSAAPRLPNGIDRIRFAVRWRGVFVSIDVDRERVRFEVPNGATTTVSVRVNGVDGTASAGEPLVISYAPPG